MLLIEINSSLQFKQKWVSSGNTLHSVVLFIGSCACQIYFLYLIQWANCSCCSGRWRVRDLWSLWQLLSGVCVPHEKQTQNQKNRRQTNSQYSEMSLKCLFSPPPGLYLLYFHSDNTEIPTAIPYTATWQMSPRCEAIDCRFRSTFASFCTKTTAT